MSCPLTPAGESPGPDPAARARRRSCILVAGIVRPSAGQVESCGVELTGLRESARRDFRIANIGLVFQDFALLDYLNVLDNILLPYRINRSLRLDSHGARTGTTTGHGAGTRGIPVPSSVASFAWRAAARRRLPRPGCESKIGARRRTDRESGSPTTRRASSMPWTNMQSNREQHWSS